MNKQIEKIKVMVICNECKGTGNYTSSTLTWLRQTYAELRIGQNLKLKNEFESELANFKNCVGDYDPIKNDLPCPKCKGARYIENEIDINAFFEVLRPKIQQSINEVIFNASKNN